jgi:hypothetical protein
MGHIMKLLLQVLIVITLTLVIASSAHAGESLVNGFYVDSDMRVTDPEMQPETFSQNFPSQKYIQPNMCSSKRGSAITTMRLGDDSECKWLNARSVKHRRKKQKGCMSKKSTVVCSLRKGRRKVVSSTRFDAGISIDNDGYIVTPRRIYWCGMFSLDKSLWDYYAKSITACRSRDVIEQSKKLGECGGGINFKSCKKSLFARRGTTEFGVAISSSFYTGYFLKNGEYDYLLTDV